MFVEIIDIPIYISDQWIRQYMYIITDSFNIHFCSIQKYCIHLGNFVFACKKHWNINLAEAFIQSDLGYTVFYQYVCSLGIEPTTFCDANAMLYH